jgi:hypothetical protein
VVSTPSEPAILTSSEPTKFLMRGSSLSGSNLEVILQNTTGGPVQISDFDVPGGYSNCALNGVSAGSISPASKVSVVAGGQLVIECTKTGNASGEFGFEYMDYAGLERSFSVKAKQSGPVTYSAPSDYVASFGFDEGAGAAVSDASANANNGQLYGTYNWLSSGCPSGSCVDFAGATGYFRTNSQSSSLNLSGKSFSILAWVKLHSQQVNYKCIYNVHPVGSGWYTLYKSNIHDLHIRVGNRYLNGVEKILPGQWYFLAGTWDNAAGRMAVYVNGQEDEFSVPALPSWGGASDSHAYIAVGLGENIDAAVDEVKVYSRALSQQEICNACMQHAGSVGVTCIC